MTVGTVGSVRVRVFFGIILLAAGNGYCAGPSDEVTLSRGYAVALALGNNPDLRIERLSSAMAETDLARSRAIYDTIFGTSVDGGATRIPGESSFRSNDATGTIGVARFLPTGGTVSVATQSGYTTTEFAGDETPRTDWQSSVGVTLTQPLLKNAGRETTEITISLAASALEETRARFRSLATDTVLDAIISYNRLYVLRSTLESRTAALDSALKLLDAIKAKAPTSQQGMEIANAEFAIAQRRRDLVDAGRNVSDQEASLRYLIGMEEKLRVIPAEPPSRDEPPGTEQDAVKAALELRSDLSQLRVALRASRLQEEIARRQVLPDLAALLNGGVTGSGGRFDDSFRRAGEDPGTFWSARLELTVPLGNTAAENDYRKWKIRTEQVQRQIDALSWRIRNEVEADLRALISARLQMQTADRSAQFAERRLEEYRKNNLAGIATVQNVIDAENDRTAARNAQMEALETFANGVARLWRDTGELLDRQGVRIETSDPRSRRGPAE